MKLCDVQIEAFVAIIYRRLGLGVAPERAPALCGTWLEDFRDTYGDAKMRPIMTVYRANPFRGRTPFEGNASYPLFAIWRAKNAWKPFTNDTDENTATAMFKWILPSEADTEKVWPLLGAFDSNMRRILEHAVEEGDDFALLEKAHVSEYSVEIKSDQAFDGPGQPSQLLYPTLTGSFTFKGAWRRTQHNLGLELEEFTEAYLSYMLWGQKGDPPPVHPVLVANHRPLQP